MTDTQTWHPMYGPMNKWSAKRLRDLFLEAEDDRVRSIDASVLEYEDFRVRHHDEPNRDMKVAKSLRKELNNRNGRTPYGNPVHSDDYMAVPVGEKVRTRPAKAIKHGVAHPIRSSQTVIRIKVKKK